MRVLHIDTGKTMRGGQWQALRLMIGLADGGVRVRLLTADDSPLMEAVKKREIDVAPLGPFAARREIGWAEVVHCHDARAHTLAWLGSMGKLVRPPIVVSRRVAFPVKEGFFSRRKFRAAALYLSVSRIVSEQLIAAGVPAERIALVPDGVAVPPYTGNRNGGAVALDSDDPGKGRELLARLPTPVEFVKDLEKAMRSAKVFLYATEQEGLGSAALVAMAHGVPVVASKVGGLKEIIRHGTTGLLVENTPEAFEAAIQRLEADEHLAERIIRNARNEVEQGYTVQRMVERTLDCYRKVLG